MKENPAVTEDSCEAMVKSLRELFRDEAYELLGELESALLELEKTPQAPDLIGRVFRAMHTLKGSGGSCGLDDVAAFTHELETFFDQVRKGVIVVSHEIINLALVARDRIKDMLDAHYRGGTSDEVRSRQVLASFRELLSRGCGKKEQARPPAAVNEKQPGTESLSSIRVATDKLDRLVNLVGELVTVQSRLSRAATEGEISEFVSAAEEVERVSAGLRDITMNIRMLPIGSLFDRFKRLVRDLSRELGKEVDLVIEGSETELDKTVIERLSDPLMHIIRNSIGHGIEQAEARAAAGKARKGTIHLSAQHSGAHVLLQIRDDGAGLDGDAIRAKALEKGLIGADTELTEQERWELIFIPGFSTASQVTDVSGRGVGMDVVKKAVGALHGSIEINSTRDAGTSITLKLPLTLAIIDGFLTKIDDEHFIFPLSLVEECIELNGKAAARSRGSRFVTLRGQSVPYIRLREHFMINKAPPDREQIVILKMDSQRIGMVVDTAIGEHQTVLKSLGQFYKDVEGISGATILGDGTVALVIDVPKLVHVLDRRKTQSNMRL